MGRSIRTTIDIDAPAERVWEVLSTFEAYGEWNPLIPRIEAGLTQGAAIDFDIMLAGRRMPIQSRMHASDEKSGFTWRGPRSRIQRVLFNGDHYFKFEPRSDGGTRFIHGEQFGGVALPLIWWWLEPKIRNGYAEMNAALKKRAEAAGD